MEELRPPGAHEVVADDGHGRLAAVRDPVDDSVGLMPSLGCIQHDQLAHPVRSVIAGEDGRELVRRPGNTPREIERIGIVGIAPVDGPLQRAVGVHYHQGPKVDVHGARVVPAAEDHLAGGQHGRMEVVILVEAQLPHPRAVGIHQVDARRPLPAVPTGNRMVRGGGGEHDPPVGQVAGVEVVHALLLARDLPEAAAVDSNLVDLPTPPVGHGEKQPVGIEV